jgi:hypothetical protein
MDEPGDRIPPDVRTEIDRRLSIIWEREGVRPLLALESGSRAWGFPSPDSDYDVRFIYARPLSAYLSLQPIRDIIEQPIVDEIDLNGWDVYKALGLMLRTDLDSDTIAEIDEMTALKAVTRDPGSADARPRIDSLI